MAFQYSLNPVCPTNFSLSLNLIAVYCEQRRQTEVCRTFTEQIRKVKRKGSSGLASNVARKTRFPQRRKGAKKIGKDKLSLNAVARTNPSFHGYSTEFNLTHYRKKALTCA